MKRRLVNFCEQGDLSTENFINELVKISKEEKVSRETIARFKDGKVILVSPYSSKADIENSIEWVENNPKISTLNGDI